MSGNHMIVTLQLPLHYVALIVMVCDYTCDLHFPMLICLGTEHNIDFVYCGCEPLVATLVRARLWPSTPKYPRMAFSFDLFDWAEALLLECQVSLKDLCNAFHIKCPHLVTKVSVILAMCCHGQVFDPSLEEERILSNERFL